MRNSDPGRLRPDRRRKRSGDRLGAVFIRLSAGAMAVNLLMVLGLLVLIGVKGLGVFWPRSLVEIRLKDGSRIWGAVVERETVRDIDPGRTEEEGGRNGRRGFRIRVRVANRDLEGEEFLWVPEEEIAGIRVREDLVRVERAEWGDFLGRFLRLEAGGKKVTDSWGGFRKALDARDSVGPRTDEGRKEAWKAVFEVAGGETVEIPWEGILDAIRPNRMGFLEKCGFYGNRFFDFLVSEPRSSNTEGGIFPAIFGTVLMVFLMTIFVTPFGVLAAIYLREYAKDGPFVRILRIAINNLAGVPSIVFGIFGLGFFVYTLGGRIDSLFFPDRLPEPTFGTGGILWASLTLALLTVPVVIVATEEGLAAVPKSVRHGSLALGATKLETIWNVVLPGAAPGILTGVILAISRAAGEVAPLMIVGMVKMAPDLPLDGEFPFLHPERKFMHLGFHIFDLGFQSPDVEATKPLVYATTLVLVVLVLVMNLGAIALRNRLRKRNATSSV